MAPNTPLPSEEESAWEVVTDKEKAQPDLAVKEEEIIDKLADDLSQVVNLDEPDFSVNGPSQDQPPTNSSEPKKPDVSTATAEDPPPSTDQPAAATHTPTPPATDTSTSTLQALEPLEATEGEGPKPTLVARPTSKSATITKVSERQRVFLVEAQPTSGDEMPPPTLQPFLRNEAKSKSAAKRLHPCLRLGKCHR